MVQAYEALWDDISKQFLTQSSPLVLSNATSTIHYLLSTTTLANTNSAKILELEDELALALRDAVAGRDEIEVASFTEDEVHALGAIVSRLSALFGLRDMTGWMEEDEAGKQTPAWDIVSALIERGRLGIKEEELVSIILPMIYLHLTCGLHGFMDLVIGKVHPDSDYAPHLAGPHTFHG